MSDFVIQILVPRQLTDLRILKTQDFNPVHGRNRYIWGGSGIHNIHYEASENTSDVVYNKKDKGRPLPKFGEWDVNDPASAEGFTVIFNKARDEKKTGGKPGSPGKSTDGHVGGGGGGGGGGDPNKPQPKKWLCCMQSPAVDS